MKTFRQFSEEMMVANAAGTSGGFGHSSNPKGPTAGWDKMLGKKKKMVRRSRIGTWAQTLRKKNGKS